jgi:hypothetical protein
MLKANRRKAYGFENRTRNVLASTTSTPSNPSSGSEKRRAGILGSVTVLKVKTASADVTGVPSSQVASGRRWNVNVRASGEISQLSASPGAGSSLRSRSTRFRATFAMTNAP